MQSIAVCTSSAGAPKTWTSGTAEGTDLSCVLAVHHAARHSGCPFQESNSSLCIEHIEQHVEQHVEQHIELYVPLLKLCRLGVAV